MTWALGTAAQGAGRVQGQPGWDLEQPGLAEGDPDHGRAWN